MTDPDFNLLVALDILLAEESVAGARAGLSASAMSRTLTVCVRSPAIRYW
jgi:hypothetical protein